MMNPRSLNLAAGLAGSALLAGSASAVTLFTEDFEDAAVGYTTSIPEFTDNSSDFFLRTDGSNISGGYSVTGAGGSFYFAGQDIDGEGATLPVTQTFGNIAIAGFQDLAFSVLLAEDTAGDGNEDWDANDDSVVFEYQIDGGGYQSLYSVLPSGSGFNSQPAVNGTGVTDAFAAFTSAIAGTGSLLDIRITWDLDSGDEDLAIDDVTVSGNLVPEPASLALVGLGGLAMLGRGRRSV